MSIKGTIPNNMSILDMFGSDALKEENEPNSTKSASKAKFCAKCGKPLSSDAKFCGSCGARVDVSSAPLKKSTTKKTAAAHIESVPHPWRRYFARMIDTMLLAVPVGFFLAVFAPDLLEEMPDLMLGIIIALVVLPYDGFCLSTWNRTLGKWIMGIIVTKGGGDSLTFGEAFIRSLLVFYRGQGLGIPIVALFTQIHQFNTLKKEGVVSWDKELKTKVSYEELKTERVIIAVVLVVIFIALIAAGADA